MNENGIIIDDDRYILDQFKELFSILQMDRTIKPMYFREIEEAEKWIVSLDDSKQLKFAILDLMFPPKNQAKIYGNEQDLIIGLNFFKKYLKDQIFTIVYTNAIHLPSIKSYIINIIQPDGMAELIEKPGILIDIAKTITQKLQK